MEQLERLIDSEQASRRFEILQRHRKSIPDGYFNEFSVNDVLDRQRRGQPISDYTDEFSADPFEVCRAIASFTRLPPAETAQRAHFE